MSEGTVGLGGVRERRGEVSDGAGPAAAAGIEGVLHHLTPRVLALLMRRYGEFDSCEDAVQEALLAAAVQWPAQGIPDNPLGWLLTVSTRRLADARRSELARQQREIAAASLVPTDELSTPAAGDGDQADRDDTLKLLFLCCHPTLSRPSQIALTLRAVGGLTTAQIARAFLVPEATMGQRIARAKQRIKASDVPFGLPPPRERAERLRSVLQVLYLVFNEGYTATSGPDLCRPDLTGEAIRLAEELHRLLPGDGEVAGLLALMLLTEARRPARTGPGGVLVPLAEQDRSRWHRAYIERGTALLTEAMARGPVGPYQIQAAIAAVHDEAARAEETDWEQIATLYQILIELWPNPLVRLNQAVAVSMVRGPSAGLELIAGLDADGRLAGNHRLDAVRAHLLEMAGDRPGARAHYERAARGTGSRPERRYLEGRAARLA